jgi:excinuclease ABC subunit A
MNINDILELTVEKAIEIFKGREKITSKLRILDDTGLGYLRLGQPLDTLSSGETSRLALARIIGKKAMTKRLFLFDEPSIGLHPFNISRLIRIFTRMIVNGATIVCIEHNPEIIKSADYVIDMGPGGGENGGRILAVGTPEEIAGNKESITGPYLQEYLVSGKDATAGQTVYNGYPVTR